jgi:hypothetical protein
MLPGKCFAKEIADVSNVHDSRMKERTIFLQPHLEKSVKIEMYGVMSSTNSSPAITSDGLSE